MQKEKKHIDFDELERSIAEGEAAYNAAFKAQSIFFLTLIFIIVVLLMIPKSFWLIPSKFSNEKLNPYNDPIKKDISENIKASDMNNPTDYSKLAEIKSLKNGNTYYILPLAKYSITARIKAKNKFFFNQDIFDKIALVDFGLVWGDMVKDEYFSKIYAYSREELSGARGLLTTFEPKYYAKLKDKSQYLSEHRSHTHVIPANRQVMRAMNAVRYGQVIKLDGYLVDVYDSSYRRFAMSSLSLYDSNESSRGHGKGGGACEVMYVMRVQIGNKVFE